MSQHESEQIDQGASETPTETERTVQHETRTDVHEVERPDPDAATGDRDLDSEL